MAGVRPDKAGHIKRLYGFTCACGWAGDLRVPLDHRDRQDCPECGGRLTRLPHFATVGFRIPGYMKSSYDECDVLPDDPKERDEFKRRAAEDRAYRPGLTTPSGLPGAIK